MNNKQFEFNFPPTQTEVNAKERRARNRQRKLKSRRAYNSGSKTDRLAAYGWDTCCDY